MPYDPGLRERVRSTIRAKLDAGDLPVLRPQDIRPLWVWGYARPLRRHHPPGSGRVRDGLRRRSRLPPAPGVRRLVGGGTAAGRGWPAPRLHEDCLELWQAAWLKRASGLSHETPSSCPPNSAARIAALLRDAFPAGYCVDCLAATKLSRLQSAA